MTSKKGSNSNRAIIEPTTIATSITTTIATTIVTSHTLYLLALQRPYALGWAS